MPDAQKCRNCHVTGQDCAKVNGLTVFHIIARLTLAVHFAAELVDKFLNWDSWVSVIAKANFPVPTFMLALVVTLLCVGTPMLVGGIFMRWTVSILLLFQIPTTVWFETGDWYEQADSISVMGGLLMALVVDEVQRAHRDEKTGRQTGCWCPKTAINRSGSPSHARRSGTLAGDGIGSPLLDPVAGEPDLEAHRARVVDATHGLGDGRPRLLSDREGEVIV